MCAVGVEGVDLAVDFDEEHLAVLDAFHFCFLLLPVLQVNGRQALELELLCHGGDAVAERSFGKRVVYEDFTCAEEWRGEGA